MSAISIIGSGYVGLVTGACLADFGNNVMCVDSDVEKIESLSKGEINIYEDGLDRLIERNVYYKRLSFTTNIKIAVEESEVIFISVGTPSKEDGSADLQYVIQAASDIAAYMNGYKVIVDKSTVPVGTGRKLKGIIRNRLRELNKSYEFDIVSNPEFLREGSAIHDFTHPDRIVIGVESEKARKTMESVYRVLYLNETPFVLTNINTAEMVKYAANAFLAMKITFINEIANLCEKMDADVHHVAAAMGRDRRIGPKFLHPGPGYGGSCFPKDTRALVRMGMEFESPVTLIEQTIRANENQKLRMTDKIKNAMGEIKGKTIGVLGITFKPNTDDIRDAPSLDIIHILSKEGAYIKVYDPQGESQGRRLLEYLKDSVSFCTSEYQAVEAADALVIITEWNQFRSLDLEYIKSLMRDDFFFDFRNIYERKLVEEKGFRYYCVGR